MVQPLYIAASLKWRCRMPEFQDEYLCHECVGDQYLKSEIQDDGSRKRCKYCGRSRKCLTLGHIAERADDVFREYFELAEPRPYVDGGSDFDGELPVHILMNIMDVDENISEDLFYILPDGSIKDDDKFYYLTSNYVEREIIPYGHSESWDFFCRFITHTSRFFEPVIQRTLDEIFEGISAHTSFYGEKPIKTIDEEGSEKFIYRARQAKNLDEIKRICLNPAVELGPPPYRSATPGRMNPSGISVFYGALERETCIAETRVPVGGFAITGKFEILTPVKILDLTVFDQLFKTVSLFDPNCRQILEHRIFLSKFHQEVCRPIQPQDEAIDYIPTQIVAEYLGKVFEPNLDGIIYSSAQSTREDEDVEDNNKNIVLLHHSSRVETDDQYDRYTKSKDEYVIDFDEYSGISIRKKRVKPDISDDKESNDSPFSLLKYSVDFPDDWETGLDDDYRESVLRLVPGSLKVHEIKSVHYKAETHYLSLPEELR